MSRYQIWIEGDLLHSLMIIAQTPPPKEDNRYSTAEDIAEEFLRTALKEKYPQLLDHQKAINKMEKELLKTLGGK
jgi:hypothetical protein